MYDLGDCREGKKQQEQNKKYLLLFIVRLAAHVSNGGKSYSIIKAEYSNCIFDKMMI